MLANWTQFGLINSIYKFGLGPGSSEYSGQKLVKVQDEETGEWTINEMTESYHKFSSHL